MRLSEGQQRKINEQMTSGSNNFSQQDFEQVMNDSETANRKAKKLGEQFKNFKIIWSLLQDYWHGNYKNVPWKMIAALGFAVAYLVSPIDVIPDFIPIVGFVDDASVFALTIAAFQSEIDAYKEWKGNERS